MEASITNRKKTSDLNKHFNEPRTDQESDELPSALKEAIEADRAEGERYAQELQPSIDEFIDRNWPKPRVH